MLANGKLLFYDKVKKERSKGQPIPELFQNGYVLRYEQRYESRLPKVFGVERVTCAMLYSEPFHTDLLNRWCDNYFAIKKINDITINFEYMKGIKEFNTLGRLCLIETAGGQLAMLSQIKEAQNSGILDKKQAHDLRQAVFAACSEKIGITSKNECISELDKKVRYAVKYYR